MQTIAALAAFLLTLSAGSAFAQPIEWSNPAGGDWGTPSNWSPMNVPDAPGEAASFALPGEYTVELSGDLVVGAVSVTNPDAVIALLGGSSLSVGTGIVNHGVIAVNPGADPAGAALHASGDLLIEGSGEVALGGVGASITSAPDATITVEHPHRVVGGGIVSAALQSDGTVIADLPDAPLVLTGAAKSFSGFLLVEENSVVLMTECEIDLTGAVALTYSGEFACDRTTVRGAGFDAVLDGRVTITGDSTFDAAVSLGGLRVLPGRTLTIENALENVGRVEVNPDNAETPATVHIATPGMTIEGYGDMHLGGQGERSRITGQAFVNSADHSISGVGRIDAPMTNLGRLTPGDIHAPGTLNATAPIVFANPGSSYRCDVAAGGVSDRIESASTVHAAGTLWVELGAGVDPDDWSATVVAAAGGVTGRFFQVLAPEPTDPRLRVRARYLPGEIRVSTACAADYDLNETLNFFDVAAYLTLYTARDREADLAIPFGTFNFFDLSAFIDEYNAGCP